MKKYSPFVIALFFIVLSLLIFRCCLSGATLLTTDDNIGCLAERVSGLPQAFFGGWYDSPLVGFANTLSLNWTNLNLWLQPLLFFNNWMHALDLILCSLLLGGFLRLRGCSLPACLLGALTAFWLGSNFTLTYAGHIGKYGVVLFAAAALYGIEKTAQTKRIAWAVLTGGAIGAMFTEQQDSALFMAMMLGPYLLFALWRENRQSIPKALLKLAGPVFVTALLIASHALLSGYQANVQGVASQSEENPQAKWEFATQWSWPPEESIAFIAPGYTGWRSGEPDGPYWGRMGRSAEWESTRQGFMNFKLENTYLGLLPVLFALFAVFSWRRRAEFRADTIFWAGATLVTLLLAFGKYFPLYGLLYQLPIVNNIRNPNKFLQVFQLAMAVLTAYGMEALFSQRLEGQKSERQKSAVGGFFWLAAGVLGFLTLWALSATLNRVEEISGFMAQGWPGEYAGVIVKNKITALWHASAMALLAVAVFSVFRFPRFAPAVRFKTWIASGLVVLVAADALYLSRHYVATLPGGYIEENAVTRLLKEQLGDQRTAMVTQESFYNLWLTYLFPYHRIPAFNFTQMPRMPQDYKLFLEAMNRNPLRMWQLCGVGCLLGPTAVEKQLPPGKYSPLLRFEVQSTADGGLSVTANEKGSQTVWHCLEPSPRYALIGGCEKLDDRQTLARLSSNDWKPFNKLILPPETQQTDPGGQGFCGSVNVVEYRPGRVVLRVQADAPGFLRAAEKYDPDWKALIDGKPADVLRADFIFQAVAVPAGEHTVELAYRPGNKLIAAQLAGMVLCLVSLLALAVPQKGEKQK